jgi:3-isopropylmalate/(R)-2-methylmalate dehydratase small subunit
MHQPFIRVAGAAAALPGANIDTDVIMPKQFLKGIDRSGLRDGTLHDLRFDAQGGLRQDFVLNRPEWRDARFLVVGPNFGCGSSREHAVWGLLQFGIRAILGTSFAGIFADNAANNGLLLVSLPVSAVEALTSLASDPMRNRLTVDLPAQEIAGDDLQLRFDMNKVRKEALLRGLDPVAGTLERAAEIRTFERAYHAASPWLVYGRSGTGP